MPPHDEAHRHGGLDDQEKNNASRRQGQRSRPTDEAKIDAPPDRGGVIAHPSWFKAM